MVHDEILYEQLWNCKHIDFNFSSHLICGETRKSREIQKGNMILNSYKI